MYSCYGCPRDSGPDQVFSMYRPAHVGNWRPAPENFGELRGPLHDRAPHPIAKTKLIPSARREFQHGAGGLVFWGLQRQGMHLEEDCHRIERRPLIPIEERVI